jgi:hypothetical protein
MLIEFRIFVGCFIAKNRGEKSVFPIKLRSGSEMLLRLKINLYGWLHNFMSLREILAKRRNRTGKLLAIE